MSESSPESNSEGRFRTGEAVAVPANEVLADTTLVCDFTALNGSSRKALSLLEVSESSPESYSEGRFRTGEAVAVPANEVLAPIKKATTYETP